MGAGLIVAPVCNAHFGGGEEHAHQIARHLTGLGEDLTYVTMLCPHPHAPFLCPDSQELERFEAACGYPIERIHNTVLGSGRWFRPSAVFSQLRLLWDLHRVLRRKRAGYIIVNQSVFLCAICCLIGKAARIPVIQIVHHLPANMGPDIRGRLRRWLARFGLRAAAVNVCVSQATASDVARFMGSNRVRTTLISNAVDVDAMDAWREDVVSVGEAVRSLQERGAIGNGPIILTVARLDEYKGIQWVIKAMPLILSQYADARYVVAGDGPYKAELERTVEAVLPPHLRGTVTFLGLVSDSEKYALYDACDVFVMPSAVEGFGLVYAEAAAFSKPAVGCDVMGVPEVIAHGETGLLVPPADADAVADAVLGMLRNATERVRMGENGRRRIESMGSWSERARQYQQLIGELRGE